MKKTQLKRLVPASLLALFCAMALPALKADTTPAPSSGSAPAVTDPNAQTSAPDASGSGQSATTDAPKKKKKHHKKKKASDDGSASGATSSSGSDQSGSAGGSSAPAANN